MSAEAPEETLTKSISDCGAAPTSPDKKSSRPQSARTPKKKKKEKIVYPSVAQQFASPTAKNKFSIPITLDAAACLEKQFKIAQDCKRLNSSKKISAEKQLKQTKATSTKIHEIAHRRFDQDRTRCKFVDVAVKILKTGSIRQSLDWVPNKDYSMLAAVFAECTFIKQISLMSDKCQEQDFNKLDADYEKDLAICAPETKFRLQKYLKASERAQNESENDPKSKDKKQKESKGNMESSISRNPRTNSHIYPSIA